MNRSISLLLDQLISTAKSSGISQKELAERAGLTPVGLSKAKQRGDIRASSLARMGEQLGLDLVLVPRKPREDVSDAIKSGAFFGVAERRLGKNEYNDSNG